MPTYEEALGYLGIDYPDEVVKRNVNRAMATAAKTLQGAIGADVLTLLPDDERVKELVLIYTDDLYTTRGVAAKVSGATRQLVHTMELQLRLELRVLREEAAGA
jgi:predicted RecB family endonuclease